MTKALTIIAAALFGGFISRWHGGGLFGGGKFWKSLAWSVPFGAITYLFLGNVYYALLSLALCFGGKATGHGKFMDLGTWKEPTDDESLEFLIKPLEKRMPTYWYDALGLATVGLAAVSGAVVTVAFQSPLAAAVIALGGIMKAPAYMIGLAVYRKQFTVIGEILTGVFAFGSLAIAYLLIGVS